MEATTLIETHDAPPAPQPPSRHGIPQALLALVLYIVVVPFVAALLIGFVSGIVTHDPHVFAHNTTLRAWTMLLSILSGCVVTLVYLRRRWRPLWTEAALPGMGFTGARAGQIAGGAALGLLAQIAGIVVMHWLGPPHPHPQLLMQALLHMPHVLWLLALPLTALLVPIVEETLFRGALFSATSRYMSAPVAAALVTTVFVLGHLPGVHWNPLHLFGVAFTGIFAIWMRWRCQSIYPAIAVHMSFNTFAMVGLLILMAHGR